MVEITELNREPASTVSTLTATTEVTSPSVIADALEADDGSFNDSITDPAGTQHTTELAELADLVDDHSKLTNVQPDQHHSKTKSSDIDHNSTIGGTDSSAHHTRYSDTEARSSVEGVTDVADLVGGLGTSGQIPQTDGANVSWVDKPTSGIWTEDGNSPKTETGVNTSGGDFMSYTLQSNYDHIRVYWKATHQGSDFTQYIGFRPEGSSDDMDYYKANGSIVASPNSLRVGGFQPNETEYGVFSVTGRWTNALGCHTLEAGNFASEDLCMYGYNFGVTSPLDSFDITTNADTYDVTVRVFGRDT